MIKLTRGVEAKPKHFGCSDLLAFFPLLGPHCLLYPHAFASPVASTTSRHLANCEA